MKRLKQETESPVPLSPLEVGTWIGKSQAFSLLAKGCSAADAACLKRLRESRSHESLGLTWEQFCTQHLGISRATADRHIQHLDEFGEPFFQLSAITPVSPESYRQIESEITEEGIEFEGEVIPITPEYAPQIRQVVATLRDNLRRVSTRIADPSITELMIRLDACFDQMSQLARHERAVDARPAIGSLIRYSMNKLKEIETILARG